MSRTFSRRDKMAAAIVQGVETLEGRHADHAVPYSAGGPTDPANCRILTASQNIAKGSSYMVLRKWQKAFIHAWTRRKQKYPFLLVATPGSGKTFAAMTAAKMWLDAASDRRLFIVVPTSNLREQWKHAAAKHGVELQTKEFGTSFKSDYIGGIVTYHMLGGQTAVIRNLLSRSQTMVVLDEPHHCGEFESWGVAAECALDGCTEMLLLSGTPWRTAGNRIPFVTYDENGEVEYGFKYDYPDALEQGVVRWLNFYHDKGKCTIAVDGNTKTLKLSRDISDEDASSALRHTLNTNGAFVVDTLIAANKKLEDVRRDVRDAGGIVVCIDQDHAVRVASILASITGNRPSVIVSDEDKATSDVDKFRKSSEPWLVSVRQVSEGTDIQRLQVLVYLTNVTTEIFFRQVIGRISRRRFEDVENAYVFLPEDPRLVRNVLNIERFQAMVVQQEYDDAKKERETESTNSTSVFIDSEIDAPGLRVIRNNQYTSEQATIIAEAALEAHVTEAQAEMIIRKCGGFNKDKEALEENDCNIPVEDKANEIRSLLRKRINVLSKRSGMEHKNIHMMFKPKQEDMTLEQLKDKLSKVNNMICESTRKKK